ncbi:MAG: sigma-70 family RNA polymerase sigma factor [Bacteroidales bacterium]|nr:sigma-70 family RNA polymerase sigma factor [Bacteroidales bacterium]
MTKEEFKGLFNRYFDSVRSYLVYRGANKEQATDLAQDVFMRVWEKQLAVDQKTALRLLYKIASDMFVSRYRREVLEMNYAKTITNDNSDFSPEDQMRYNELFASYTKALSTLGEKQRTVFLMARMDGLKYHEIAERLDISVKAVEKRMTIALAHLKKELKE